MSKAQEAVEALMKFDGDVKSAQSEAIQEVAGVVSRAIDELKQTLGESPRGDELAELAQDVVNQMAKPGEQSVSELTSATYKAIEKYQEADGTL